MNELRCRYCHSYLDMFIYCRNPNCPYGSNTETQDAESFDFEDPSHPGAQILQEARSKELTVLQGDDVDNFFDNLASIGENPTAQLQFPIQAGQPAMPESNEEFRNFENAQTSASNQKNLGYSEWNVQQQAVMNQWPDEGMYWQCDWPPTNEGISASGTVSSFGNIVQMQFPPSLQQPVQAPYPAPIASTSREGFQATHVAGYYGREAQSDFPSIYHFENPMQQAIAGQGKSDVVEEPLGNEEIEMGASGPHPTRESIVQSQSPPSLREPEACPILADSNPGPRKIDTEHTTQNNRAYCVMCEIECGNLYRHWENWHSDNTTSKTKTRNLIYRIFTEFDQTYSRLLLLPSCTDPMKELTKCQECKKVFYTHRYYNHGCPVPSTSSAQPDASYAPALTSKNKQKGFCLMCRFSFDDLDEHKRQMHVNNKKGYDTKIVLGQWTLLPIGTCDALELMKCQSCSKIMYKHHFNIGDKYRPKISDYCPNCRPAIKTKQTRKGKKMYKRSM